MKTIAQKKAEAREAIKDAHVAAGIAWFKADRAKEECLPQEQIDLLDTEATILSAKADKLDKDFRAEFHESPNPELDARMRELDLAELAEEAEALAAVVIPVVVPVPECTALVVRPVTAVIAVARVA